MSWGGFQADFDTNTPHFGAQGTHKNSGLLINSNDRRPHTDTQLCICIFLVKLWIRTKHCVATTYMCTALGHEAIHYIFVAVVHFWFMGLTQLCLNCPLAFNPSTLPSCSWDHLRGCNSRSWEHPPWLTLRSPRLIAKLVAMRKSSPISKINFFANNLPSHLWRLSSPGLSLLIRSSTYRVFDVVFVSMLSVFWSDHSPAQ